MHHYEVILKTLNLVFDYTNDDPKTFKHTINGWNVWMIPQNTESIVQTHKKIIHYIF